MIIQDHKDSPSLTFQWWISTVKCSLLALAPAEMTCVTKQSAMTSGVGKGELLHCLLSIIIIIRSLQILKVFLPEVLCQQTKGSVHWCRGERARGGGECCDQSTLSKAKQTYIHVRSLQYQLPKVPKQKDSITKHTHKHLGVYMAIIPFLAVQ